MNTLENFVRYTRNVFRLGGDSRTVTVLRPAYSLLMNLFYGRSGLPRSINGQETIRVLPSRRQVAEAYEPAVFDYLKRAIRPGAVVLDVGANVGVFTILLARWAGPVGHVYAFEPDPETLHPLQEHLALNGVRDRVTTLPIAVSDRTGLAILYTEPHSTENTLCDQHPRLRAAQAVEVPLTTIDTFCAEQTVTPTLIKVDIEGFEVHALRGARETMLRHRPIVVVEVHPMNWPAIGVNGEEIVSLAAERGYRLLSLEGQTDPLAALGHVLLEPTP